MKAPIHLLTTAISFFIMLVFSLQAGNYYVDQKHPNADDKNPGTIDLPWKTITQANKALVSGDTVFIKAGVYNSYIAPDKSGSSSSPITYRNYGADSVVVSDTSYGIRLRVKSFISVQGINFYNLDKFLWLDSANNNIIAYCCFDQGRTIGWSGSKIYNNSSYNWVHHCRFSKYGKYTDDDIGAILDVGNEETKTDSSNYNLIENCIMFHAGHHILGVYGMFNVVRNSYFHNENWLNNCGNRNVYLSGYAVTSGRNLIQGNRIAYSGYPPPADGWGASGMALTTAWNIVRFNLFYHNNLSGVSMSVTSTYCSDILYNKIYNNTLLHNGYNMSTGPDAMTSAIGFAIYSGTLIIKNNTLKNNLYRGHYQAHGSYKVNLADQIIANNWDGDKQGDPKFVNADTVLGNPMDSATPDLHLQPTSPCINAGTYLTPITSPSGSGTSFFVEDAGYFMDGWTIPGVAGDEIQLYQTNEIARVTKVDYATNTITTDKNLTWTQNQGVCLVYHGSAPDVGAFEYQGNDINDPQIPHQSRLPVIHIYSGNRHGGAMILQLGHPFNQGEIKRVALYNLCGTLIMEKTIHDNFLVWNTLGLSGMYVIKIRINRCDVARKIVVLN